MKTNVNYCFIKFFINKLFRNGKKEQSEQIIFSSVKKLQKTFYKNHRVLIIRCFIKISPILGIKRIKRSQKSITMFPFVLKTKNRMTLGIKIFVEQLRQHNVFSLNNKIIKEIFAISRNENKNYNIKKLSTYEQAFVLKKYTHYRWF